jgi:glycosyltransferase involved in cell wall biosynthesis
MTIDRHFSAYPIQYTLLVPRLDTTGPTNLAVDLANGMATRGLAVQLLYLGGNPQRSDIHPAVHSRRFRWSDVLATPGIVHSHGLRPDLVAALMSLVGPSTAITTLHGHFPFHLAFDYSSQKARAAWWVWRVALSRFARIICLSATMRRFYQHSFRLDQLVTAYNFRTARSVDSGALDVATTNWIADQRTAGRAVLIFVGSLTRRKNVVPLARAVAKSDRLALIVCGLGPDLAEIEAVAATASARIMLAGHVVDVQSIVAACDCLVLPSHAEGLSLAALEAGQVGVPLLLSNIAVHRELAVMKLGTIFDQRRFSDFEAKALGYRNSDPAASK